jgi:hypothetical protein
LHIIESILS